MSSKVPVSLIERPCNTTLFLMFLQGLFHIEPCFSIRMVGSALFKQRRDEFFENDFPLSMDAVWTSIFSNSLTFPGQLYSIILCRAFFSTPLRIFLGYDLFFSNMLNQQRDVGFPFPERRNFDRRHFESVVKVFSE